MVTVRLSAWMLLRLKLTGPAFALWAGMKLRTLELAVEFLVDLLPLLQATPLPLVPRISKPPER